MPSKTLDIEAIELILRIKYHGLFTIPATGKHGPLKVSYSLAGTRKGTNVSTILFCGGMFGTRWQATFHDWIAQKHKVRVLYIDRPGFGASTPVPLCDRIATFLEIVPLLLAHLEIKHVALACQSAGTIYALNLLARYPDLLDPSYPRVTFFSPWVHQSISSVALMVRAAKFPDHFLNKWNTTVGFMMKNARPALQASKITIATITSNFAFAHVIIAADKRHQQRDEACVRNYGIGLAMKREMEKLIIKSTFEESTLGANEEIRLCLESSLEVNWAACKNYEEYVTIIAEIWKQRVQNGARKLMVNVVLPEHDMFVGKKGMRYFEDCWAREKAGDGIEVKIINARGHDHESTISPSRGFLEEMFEDIGTRAVGDHT